MWTIIKNCVKLFNMDKQQIIAEFQKKPNDTGSPACQIALLTARIAELTTHLQANKQDLASKRGLAQMVSDRKKLLEYMKRTDLAGYRQLKDKLGLR